tara:strand:+ start:152 stop:1228 length:1077 start_codon:yes stop_codon:yes gene_type:complete
MNKKIIICTGGTGGHVIPAINLGNYLLHKGYDCRLILDKRGYIYSKTFNGKIYIINSSHLSGNIFLKFKSLITLIFCFFKSFILFIKIKPTKCISFGSYATFMPLLSVLILKLLFKINIYIHEQNSVIGKVNLFFLPYSEYIFSNFDIIRNLDNKFLQKKLYAGLPSKLKNYNLKPYSNKDKKIIFLYGGSQGSIPLINIFLLLLKNFDKNFIKEIKIIIQSPKNYKNIIKKELINLNIDFEINEFYENIEEILSITSVALSRSGSGTINDLIYFKIPSIIIPLPHSIYNHQYYNAKYLSDKNAAILIDEKDINIDKTSKVLKNLLFDNNQHKEMKQKLDNIYLPDANKIIFNKIYHE